MSICSDLFGNLRREGGGEREREITVKIFFCCVENSFNLDDEIKLKKGGWIIKSVFHV